MNLDVEKMKLIDFSTENDFLIDSHFDNTFLDLRLSVALEGQNELVRNSHSRICPDMKDRGPIFGEKERGTFRVEKDNRDNVRKSLAWDHAFFTSPGILELEELCLVNQGFKNLDLSPSHESEDVKSLFGRCSKVCQERNVRHKLRVGASDKQKNQASVKAKVAYPSKMMSMQGSKQQMTSGRSNLGMVAKSHFVQNPNSRKESLKSTGIRRSQNGVSTVQTKKPPSRAISKSGLGMTMSQQFDSRSFNSVSSSQSLAVSFSTNNSVDFSPYKTSKNNVQTASLLKSQEMEGGSRKTSGIKGAYPQDSHSFSYDINASQDFNLEGLRDNQRHHSCIKGSLGRSTLRQNAPSATKRSPLSSMTSSLRPPSQTIGFFDMKPKAGRHDQDGVKHSTEGQRRKQPSFKKQAHCPESEEKENIFHPDDTVIELELKTGTPSPSQLVSSCSATSNGQCSSSSQKCLTKSQQPTRQTVLSSTRTRTPLFTKVSPLKRSALF